jgi:uncharacterized protein (TIGR03437 family)
MLNREEALATILTTIDYRLTTADFHLVEFKRVVRWELQRAHLLLPQVRGLINYRIPPEAAAGFGSVTIAANGTQSSSNINVASVYPNLFTQAGDGRAAAYTVTNQGNLYLVLAGTGFSSATSVTATIGGMLPVNRYAELPAQVIYAGPQGTYPGLDQINILVPPSLAGSGRVDVIVTAGGKVSNPVYVTVP